MENEHKMLSDIWFCQWELITGEHVLETMVREAKVDRDLQSAEPPQQMRTCVNTHWEFGFNDVLGFHWEESGGQTVGKTGKPSANNVRCMFSLAKCTLVFFMYIYNLESIWKRCACVYTSVCLSVGHTVWWYNSRILPAQSVGGSRQKSQWVKRLRGCVSTGLPWGCRRTALQTQQYTKDRPFSRLTGWHTCGCTVNKGAGEVLPFSHLHCDTDRKPPSVVDYLA